MTEDERTISLIAAQLLISVPYTLHQAVATAYRITALVERYPEDMKAEAGGGHEG